MFPVFKNRGGIPPQIIHPSILIGRNFHDFHPFLGCFALFLDPPKVYQGRLGRRLNPTLGGLAEATAYDFRQGAELRKIGESPRFFSLQNIGKPSSLSLRKRGLEDVLPIEIDLFGGTFVHFQGGKPLPMIVEKIGFIFRLDFWSFVLLGNGVNFNLFCLFFTVSEL